MTGIREQPLQQTEAVLGRVERKPVADTQKGSASYRLEREIHESSLLRLCPADIWPKNSYNAGCPRPILVAEHHQQQLAELHQALATAITDIVERWWTDTAANFPQRMPLQREEEDLLRWMESQVPNELAQFRCVLGSWRPDFLVEGDPANGAGSPSETFCVTEINARFSFNGFLHEAFGQQALLDNGIQKLGLDGGTDPAQILGGLCRLFRPDRPLHFLKGKEPGMDIHMFVDFLRRHLGLWPRIIAPEDLRLVPDDKSLLGYKLCCLAPAPEYECGSPVQDSLVSTEGEAVEEIHQVGLELHQHELLALPTIMLRHLSLRCFNDLRTILLVHDKRMLGIVRQELDSLVDRSVITRVQAGALRRGIAETLLPGSPEIEDLLCLSDKFSGLKNGYILKPIRGGKGAGILFGDELSEAEWVSHLQQLRCLDLVSGGTTYVVQRQGRIMRFTATFSASGPGGAAQGVFVP